MCACALCFQYFLTFPLKTRGSQLGTAAFRISCGKKFQYMTTEIILRYFHFISIFAIVSTLVAEHLLLKKSLTRAEIGRLARIDAVYGIAALTLLCAGLTLWLGGFG